MIITRLLKTISSGCYKGHFGQWAEDVLVRKLFPRKKKTGTYLDVGAFHPFRHSNTAYLWLKGWNGVNVDANPHTIKLFDRARTTDKNIWSAVIPNADYLKGVREIDLMLPSCNKEKGVSAIGTCNTKLGSERNFDQKIKVPAKSINQIIADCNIVDLDYLNIDVEGFDEQVVKDLDFSIVKPKVISVEDYSESIKDVISSGISTTIFANGYELAGRAGPTSIFCHKGLLHSN